MPADLLGEGREYGALAVDPLKFTLPKLGYAEVGDSMMTSTVPPADCRPE